MPRTSLRRRERDRRSRSPHVRMHARRMFGACRTQARTRARSRARPVVGGDVRRSPRDRGELSATVGRTFPAKIFFGRSPGVAVGAARSPALRDVVVVRAVHVRCRWRRMSTRMCREVVKPAPRLAFRAFRRFVMRVFYGHPDVYTSSMTSVRMIARRGFGGVSGGLPRRFGNCLFPLRNLLTRAFDSTSFRVGVTNKSRKHDCDTLHRPLR